MSELRPIRFLIYLTTLAYSLVVILSGPSTEPSILNPGVFTSPVVGATVGVTQLLACIVGLVVDSRSTSSRLIKPLFLILTVTFLYEAVLEIIIGREPFEWIPFLVYAALSSVIYLSEG
jgi:hypothetical protein